MATIEVTFEDGTSARWATTETQADAVSAVLTKMIGQPDTIKV